MNTARILSFILLPLLTFAQAPAPYPVLVDSQRATVPALEVFQANAITFRASFKSGNVANGIVTESPFMYWQPFGATNATVVTANWSIVSAPAGTVDFAFTPADLNFAAGTYSYQVGLEQSGGPQVIKQGSFTIKPSQASIGAEPIAFATTNVNWGLINWTGVPDFEYQTNTIAQVATLNASIATASNALSGQINTASNALNDRITTVSNSLFATSVAYSNALHTQIQAVNDASKWSQFQATQTVNMANNSITNAGNVQAVSINGDGTAIDIPHIHGTLAGNIYIHIRNGTGSTIAKGTPVYVIGNVGAGDRKLVAPAQSGDPTKMPAIALAEANLTANADGDGVILGEIRTYNTVTNSWTINTELYVAPLGGLTSTVPTNGLVQSVGQVSRTNSVNGIIVAQIQGAVLPKESFLASTTTFVAVESDPIFTAVSNSINTRITAVETGKVNLSVYTPATQALWAAIGNIVSAENALTNVTASGRITAVKTGAQVALTFDASGLATGTPIYNVDGKLDSNTWAAADSTTNYASRLSFVSVSNTVAGLSTNVEARLASNVWASADSTTNYALRTTFVTATNALNNKFTNYLPLAGGTMSGSLSVDNIESLDYINLGGVNPINVNGGQFGGTWSFLNQPTIPGYLTTSTWATADSTTNYASRIAFVSVSNTVTALGTNVAARLDSNVWAAADSTTNYASRIAFTSFTNSYATADATTNYALRTTFVEATNSLQTNVNARLASNVWAAADSTTNYASRITFNATSNALNSSITSLAARAFVYSTNLTAIAGSGLGVESNRLVVTNLSSSFDFLLATNLLMYTTYRQGFEPKFTNTTQSIFAGNIKVTGESTNTNYDFRGTTASNSIGSIQMGEFDYNPAGVVVARETVANMVGSKGSGQYGLFRANRASTNFVRILNSHGAQQRMSFSTGITGAGDGGAIITNSHGASQFGLFSSEASSKIQIVNSAGAIQSGRFTGSSISAGRGFFEIRDSDGSMQLGRSGVDADKKILSSSYGAIQSVYVSYGEAIISNSAYGAVQLGAIDGNNSTNSSAINEGVGAIQLLGNDPFVNYYTTPSGKGSILLGPGTQTNAYGILANGPIESLNSLRGNFVGNAANLTNFPSSLLTVTAGNENYWRITTAPTGATSSGSSGQMAVSGTNLFIYSPNALGVGTARWLRVSGDVSW